MLLYGGKVRLMMGNLTVRYVTVVLCKVAAFMLILQVCKWNL